MHLIIGCGYTGRRLRTALAASGPVLATNSSADSARDGALAWDLDAGAVAPFAPEQLQGSVVIYLVPPPRSGMEDPRLARALAALPGLPRRVVYLSTVGVYGDRGGAPVDEDTPPQPVTPRAVRRLDAETRLREFCAARSVEWVILRVPAIYGPGRLPIERLQRGLPTLRESEAGPGNRIHVDDLVQACVAAATLPRAANRIYNVGDGMPISATAFITLVAGMARIPLPPSLPMNRLRRRLPPQAMSFLEESRLVDTTRMREELGVRLIHATPDSGIRASLPQD